MSTALNHYVTVVLSRQLQEDLGTRGPRYTPVYARRRRERPTR